jgi:hypothetical protein
LEWTVLDLNKAGNLMEGIIPDQKLTQNPTHENLEARLLEAFRRLSLDDQVQIVNDVEAWLIIQ